MTIIKHQLDYLATVQDPRTYQDDVLESVRFILRSCANSLNVSRVGLWMVADGAEDMTCISLYRSEDDSFEEGAILSPEAYPKYFNALVNSRVIDATDARTDLRTDELTETYLDVLDVRSLLDATIRNVTNGDLQGVLCAEMQGEQRTWLTEEQMFVASISDLLAQRLVTSSWAESERSYQALFDGSSEAIMVFDGACFKTANPAALEMFGCEHNELVGLSPADVSPEFQPDGTSSEAGAVAHVEKCFRGESQRFDWVLQRLDGSTFDAEIMLNLAKISGEDTLFAMVRDVSHEAEAKRQALLAQKQLEYRATHDSLTGLLNRDQLHQHVDRIIGQQRVQEQIALLLLDLNRFKEINDTLGHSTGDKVLVALASVLEPHVVSMGGALFRLGGDEFVAVFESAKLATELDDLFDIFNECLASSVEVDGVSFEMSASIGAALFPDNGSDSHELLRCADIAMYHGKNHDGASPWYSKDADATDRHRIAIMSELRQGIRDGELVLHYQPRININSGAVTGCEALVRWQHPDRGLLYPIDFLFAAEMTEVIHPLTECVLWNAFYQINHLRSRGFDVPIAVNISARNLPDTRLFDLIETQLAERNIPPELLEIEITESALINNPRRSLQNLNRLEALGVSIAIDDFGTGYSSLSLLKQLPLDTIKIDRSFVNDMLENATDQVIVNSTISLAHNFSAKVVAEGVEDQETLDALGAQKCDEAQGYFIARPMSAELFDAWLEDRFREAGAA